MIPPAHVSKTSAHAQGRSKPVPADPIQWQQAVQAVTKPVEQPAPAPHPSAAKNKQITVPVWPAISAEPTGKKTVPATKLAAQTVKKADTPPTIPGSNIAVTIPTQTAAPATNHNGGGTTKPKPFDDAPAPADSTSTLAIPAPSPAPAAAIPGPQPSNALLTAANPQRPATPNIRAEAVPPTNAPPATIEPLATASAAVAKVSAEAGIKQNSPTPLPAFAAMTGAPADQATATAAPAPAIPLPAITPDAANLAAAVTAMHQSGETTATLQLDPPGLGTLTIHLGIGQNSAVNVQFITAVPQTTQIIANHLNDLRDAMANAGLSLGNTQVGSGNGGGGPGGGDGAGRQNAAPSTPPQPVIATASVPPPAGIRAYA